MQRLMDHDLGCTLLSNSNLILGVQNTGTFPVTVITVITVTFLSNRFITVPLLMVV